MVFQLLLIVKAILNCFIYQLILVSVIDVYFCDSGS